VLGKLSGPVLVVALLAVACSGSKPMLNPDDPFDDPFFHDGLGSGTSSLDEIMREPAPSVGWLAAEGAVPPSHRSHGGADGSGAQSGPDGEGVLLEAEGDGSNLPKHASRHDEDDDDAEAVPGMYGQKSFYDKAQEATMATMSILVGAGMAALPFLIGT